MLFFDVDLISPCFDMESPLCKKPCSAFYYFNNRIYGVLLFCGAKKIPVTPFT